MKYLLYIDILLFGILIYLHYSNVKESNKIDITYSSYDEDTYTGKAYSDNWNFYMREKQGGRSTQNIIYYKDLPYLWNKTIEEIKTIYGPNNYIQYDTLFWGLKLADDFMISYEGYDGGIRCIELLECREYYNLFYNRSYVLVANGNWPIDSTHTMRIQFMQDAEKVYRVIYGFQDFDIEFE